MTEAENAESLNVDFMNSWRFIM